MRAQTSLLIAAAFAAASLPAQDRTTVLRGARILTMSDQGTIEDGVVVMENGLVTAVGKAGEVEIPPGADTVDMSGKTLMPGLVHAWSRAGLGGGAGSRSSRIPARFRGRIRFSRGRSRSSGAANKAATTFADKIYARQEIFGDLLAEGVTTLVVAPLGDGFPGQSARLDPAAPGDLEDDEVYLVVDPEADSKTKKLLETSFEKALEVIEARKKEAEEAKKAAAEAAKKKAEEEKKKAEAAEKKEEGEKKEGGDGKEPEKKPEGEKQDPKDGEKKPEQKKEPEKKPRKKDPNLEVLADLLSGDRRAFVRLASAKDVVHFERTLPEDKTFAHVVVAESYNTREGLLEQVVDDVRALKPQGILVQPQLTTSPGTSQVLNPAANLIEAGFEVGFLMPDSPAGLRRLWFELMELVRTGLAPDKALAALTAVPARFLGLEDEVGSIAVDHRADLLVWSGDPFDPRSRLLEVYRGGRAVRTERAGSR